MGTRRQFSRELKVEAVKLVTERGVVVAQAARDLDLHETRQRTWICIVFTKETICPISSCLSLDEKPINLRMYGVVLGAFSNADLA